jgi:hypothetical protein
MLTTRLAIIIAVAMLAPVAAQDEATFADGRYTRAGISVTVPAEWSYVGTRITAATSALAQWGMKPVSANFYAQTITQGTPDLDTQMAQAIDNKTRQRQGDGYRQWRVRDQSVRRASIGGHPALMAVADWQQHNGAARVEYLAWVFTPERRLFLFAYSSPSEEAAFQPVFDRIAQSATLP